MKKYFILPLLLMACMFTACDDSTDGVGYSLTDTSDRLTVVADTFSISSETVRLNRVISRSTTGYLGKIKDAETNTYITSNFMGQLSCIENTAFPSEEKLIKTDGEIKADSCALFFYYTTYSGDSTVSMKCKLTEFAKPLSEDSIYAIDFKPTIENGYIREDGINESITYSLIDYSLTDSARWASNYRGFRIPLNNTYTDADGKTYNNFGTYIMKKYYENPDYMKNSYNFIHNVFPGFYLQSTGGIGCMANISLSQLFVYYKYKSNDSIFIANKVFSGSEEVLQKTSISQDNGQLEKLKEEGSHTYLKTPAGLYTQVTLPVDKILDGHEGDTLNTARVYITRENNTSTTTDYTLPVPTTVLILPTDSVDYFFANSKVADYRDSYLASYSSSTNGYSFGNIGGMIRNMGKIKSDYMAAHSGCTDAQYEQLFPNWNKAVIVPVTTSYTTVSSSSVLTRVAHDMSLQSTKLVGGIDNPGVIKVSCIYSKFKK